MNDEDLCIYLLLKLYHHCFYCGTIETPQWRKGEFCEAQIVLCNACGLKSNKNKNKKPSSFTC